jgi:hypothetical protein
MSTRMANPSRAKRTRPTHLAVEFLDSVGQICPRFEVGHSDSPGVTLAELPSGIETLDAAQPPPQASALVRSL